MRKLKNLAAAIALGTCVAVAAPAMAQGYYHPRELRAELADIARDLDHIGRTNRLTNSEYRGLSNRVAKIDELIHRYGRDGFTRAELAGLSDRIDILRADLRRQARDGDRLRRRY